MPRLLSCLIGGFMAIQLAAGAASANDEDAKLVDFFRRHLDAQMKQHPAEATRLGDHRHDDRLDDLSPAARAADVERLRTTQAELPKQVDYQKLSRGSQIDYEILATDLKYRLWIADNTRPYEQDPRVYGEV